MRFETRLELALLLIIAAVVGGWIGLRLVRKGRPPAPPVVNNIQSERAAEATEPTATRSTLARTAAESASGGPAVANPPGAARAATSPRPAVVASEAAAPEAGADWERALSLIAQEKTFEARALLTRCLLAAGEGPQRERIRRKLDELNATLFFSRIPSPDCEFYTVQPGDTLSGIAKKYGKDYYFSHLLQRLNNIRDPGRLRVGYRLKVPKGRFSALVQKHAHRLILFFNGHYIKEYPVCLGAPTSPTPEETFKVATKEVNPTWYAPDGHVYKFGHPKNILGTRWIGFEAQGPHQSYGIHGTSDPSSIGKDVSNGCVRLLNDDVEELFSALMEGDEVKIVR